MQLTTHAVEQYIARCRPGLSYPAAVAELQAHVDGASHDGRTSAGDEVYAVPALHCRLVTRRERGRPVVVTILADGERSVPPTCPCRPLTPRS